MTSSRAATLTADRQTAGREADVRILVVGGTRFIGRHFTAAAIGRGHEVTLFHRGRTGVDLFPEATHLLGDRDSDLSALASGRWDATIDVCAYVPRHVHSLADVLGERGGRYVYISSLSAYASPQPPLFTEDAPLIELPDPTVEKVTDETYGGLKVLCERAAAERFGAGVAVIRPTYVVGPFDYIGRFTWWVRRIARGGEVLAPEPADAPIQLIDARDMATWIVDLVERETGGTFHAVSPAPPFGFRDMLSEILAVVGPPGTTFTWVGRSFLLDAGENDMTLPMWPGGDPVGMFEAADPSRAEAAGLAPRPLAQTIRETLDHEQAQPTKTFPGVGLPAEREADLLARWHAQPATAGP
jgi:2'-hydroxyisoflavone reductase